MIESFEIVAFDRDVEIIRVRTECSLEQAQILKTSIAHGGFMYMFDHLRVKLFSNGIEIRNLLKVQP